MGTLPTKTGRVPVVIAEDADNETWRLEPGHYLDTAGGLVAATHGPNWRRLPSPGRATEGVARNFGNRRSTLQYTSL
jgi:hypothetical protein